MWLFVALDLEMPIEFEKREKKKRSKTTMASLFKIVDLLHEKEYTDESEEVKCLVKDLTENPGSYIISNELKFYALHKCGYIKSLISALRQSSKLQGESPIIHKHILKLINEHENISTVADHVAFMCSMVDITDTVKSRNLRVSKASLMLAKEHFSEFDDFIDTLKEHNVDFPVYNFTSIS